MDRYCFFCGKDTKTVDEDCVVCGLSKPRIEKWRQNMAHRKPVKGELKERCLGCGNVWWFPSRDIHSPSIVDCPECGSTHTESLGGYVDEPDEPDVPDEPVEPRLCSVCVELQRETPSGWVCKNGHDGADCL